MTTCTPITRDNASDHREFHTHDFNNADGTPMRARRNGQTKTWKTRPTHYRIPIKYGLYGYGSILHDGTQWFVGYSCAN